MSVTGKVRREIRFDARTKSCWEANGYLILAGFFSRAEMDAANALIAERIDNPALFENATVDVLTAAHAGKRFRGTDAPREGFEGRVNITAGFTR